MKTKHIVLKSVMAVISGAVGGFFGLFGGTAGSVVGIISGLAVGYYYVHFTLNIKSQSGLIRIFLGTLNGALAGIISGVSVHVPGLFVKQGHSFLGSGSGALFTGATFGIIIGTVFGFIGAIIIASIPRDIDNG